MIAGGSPISPKIARHLLRRFDAAALTPSNITRNITKQGEVLPGSKSKVDLTERESEVLLLISQGYKRKEIAGSLFVTINTIGTHINNIYRKLSVGSNIDAIKEAFRQGLL